MLLEKKLNFVRNYGDRGVSKERKADKDSGTTEHSRISVTSGTKFNGAAGKSKTVSF